MNAHNKLIDTVSAITSASVGSPATGSATTGSATTGSAGLTTEERVRQTLNELDQLARQLNEDDQYSPSVPATLPETDTLVSIVVPIFNEVNTLRKITARLLSIPLNTEIVMVDDGSTDGTIEQLHELAKLPNVKVILKAQNSGKGAALRTGFEHTTGDVVLVQDADLEYDPRDIPGLIQPIIENQADVVYGSRFLTEQHENSSFIHRLGNKVLTWCSNVTTGLGLTDMETCYKVFDGDVIRQIPVRQNRFGFEPEVTAKIARRGLRVVELPIRYVARDWQEGKKIGIKDAISAFYCICRYALRD
ncbi:MAG: glycosyltransferase family 2 protein [Pirellulaceae bacterium]